jgi:hypothetical protein
MQEENITEAGVSQPSPHIVKGFIGGVGIMSMLAGTIEYFDHSLCPGTTTYLEKIQCLARKPVVWGGVLAAGVAGIVIDAKNTKIKEATDKNRALIEILEDKDRHSQTIQPEVGATTPPASGQQAHSAQRRQPLANHSELVKRVDYIEEPLSPAR